MTEAPAPILNSKKKRSWERIKITIYVATVVTLVIFLIKHRDQFQILFNLPKTKIASALLLSTLPPFVNSLRFREMVTIFGERLVFKEWFGLTICNTFYNFIFPAQAGLMMRALYMKRFLHFPYKNYLLMQGVNVCVNTFVAAALTIPLSCYVTMAQQNPPDFIVNILLVSCMYIIILYVIYMASKKNMLSSHRFDYICIRFSGLSNLLTTARRQLIHVALLQALLLFLASYRIFYMFSLFDIHPSFLHVLFIQILINITLLISITPGNIGISEGIMSYFLSMSGHDMKLVFVAMLADRTAVLVVFFILGTIFSKILLNRKLSEES